MNAEAFTVGHDIVLGSAATASPERRRWLLAHEVAHASQQDPLRAGAGRPGGGLSDVELEADRFAAAAQRSDTGIGAEPVVLSPASIGLARKVIWKFIQDLPYDLLLILDVDDGDFVGGCVRAIAPHVGVKLIKKVPHTQLFNLHVGFLTNPAGEFCIFFYESVTGLCEMKCFPSKQALRDAWDEVVEWLKDMLKKLLELLAIAALLVALAILAYLIAQAIAAALLVLLAA
jgi:hypothetical protein